MFYDYFCAMISFAHKDLRWPFAYSVHCPQQQERMSEVKKTKSLTVFVLSDALQRNSEEGRVRVVVPNEELAPSGDVQARPVEDARPKKAQKANCRRSSSDANAQALRLTTGGGGPSCYMISLDPHQPLSAECCVKRLLCRHSRIVWKKKRCHVKSARQRACFFFIPDRPMRRFDVRHQPAR